MLNVLKLVALGWVKQDLREEMLKVEAEVNRAKKINLALNRENERLAANLRETNEQWSKKIAREQERTQEARVSLEKSQLVMEKVHNIINRELELGLPMNEQEVKYLIDLLYDMIKK